MGSKSVEVFVCPRCGWMAQLEPGSDPKQVQELFREHNAQAHATEPAPPLKLLPARIRREE